MDVHYYICTAEFWSRAPTLIEAIEKLPKRREPFEGFCFMNIWQVPGNYEEQKSYHLDNYAPQVEGKVLVYAHDGAKEVTHEYDT